MSSGIRKNCAHRFAVDRADQLDRIDGQARVAGCLMQQADNRLAGMERLLATTKNDRIAGLHANGRGIGRHIGPRFVDEKHHPSGTRILLISNPLGRTDESITCPIGSRNAATSSKPMAIPSIRSGVSRRRSVWASVKP